MNANSRSALPQENIVSYAFLEPLGRYVLHLPVRLKSTNWPTDIGSHLLSVPLSVDLIFIHIDSKQKKKSGQKLNKRKKNNN